MWYWRRESGSGPVRMKAAFGGTKMVAAAEGRRREGEARRRVRAIERKPESVRVCTAVARNGSVVEDAWVVVGKRRRMRRTSVSVVGSSFLSMDGSEMFLAIGN